MSYEPHTWVDQELISDQKMNHIENGIYNEETRATNAETLLSTGISDEEARARNAEALLAPQATTYTKTEVDNMVSALSSGLDWKEAVATYADIATTYPDPEDGWTVNVKDTDITYRYDGTAWVAISANAIPKATSSLDGLMAKEDYSLLHGLSPEKIGFGYGTCSTASGTTAKTVSVTDFVLKENGMVVVAFTNAVEAGATLNVNSTGAKAIYYRGVALVADVINAGDTVTFVYDGTYYHVTAIDIGGSGGSGGHVIQNPSGTDMAQEPNMQFVDSHITDDTTNDVTKVEIVKEVTMAQFINLPTDGSADGIYKIGDGQGGSGIDADDVSFDNTGTGMSSTTTGGAIRELNAEINRGEVSVTADGVKTNRTLFNELFALVDMSKVTYNTKLIIGTGVYSLTRKENTFLLFGCSMYISDIRTYAVRLNSSTSEMAVAVISTNGTVSYSSSTTSVADEGTVFTLKY